MGLFSGLFGGHGSNPADAAKPYLDQIPGMEKKHFDPFINKGEQAYGEMHPILQQMMQDPTSFINSIMSRYQESPGARLKRNEALSAAGNTAAAGGMRGSIQDIDNESSISNRMMDDGMQQWLGNILGVQNQGLSEEGHIFDTGYDASKNLAGDMSNVLGQQAQYAFQGAREKNQRGSDLFSGLMKGIGSVAGFL